MAGAAGDVGAGALGAGATFADGTTAGTALATGADKLGDVGRGVGATRLGEGTRLTGTAPDGGTAGGTAGTTETAAPAAVAAGATGCGTTAGSRIRASRRP